MLGKCITVEIEPSELVGDLAAKLMTRQHIEEKYLPAMLLMFAGRKLAFGKTFEEERIQRDSTISQLFLFEVMEMIGKTDPITLDPIAQPLRLNPGCQHYFEASSLLAWMQTQKQNGHEPTCPTCRAVISSDISATAMTC